MDGDYVALEIIEESSWGMIFGRGQLIGCGLRFLIAEGVL